MTSEEVSAANRARYVARCLAAGKPAPKTISHKRLSRPQFAEVTRRYYSGADWPSLAVIFGCNMHALRQRFVREGGELSRKYKRGGDGSSTKVCTACQVEKPKAAFYPSNNPGAYLGCSPKCKTCEAKRKGGRPSRNYSREYYATHTAEIKERASSRYRNLTDEQREQRRAQAREYMRRRRASALWLQESPDRLVPTERGRAKQNADALSDRYLAQALRLPVAIAGPLIPVKRAQLQIHRALKKRQSAE